MLDEVLEEVNLIREMIGSSPLNRLKKGDEESCPITNSLPGVSKTVINEDGAPMIKFINKSTAKKVAGEEVNWVRVDNSETFGRFIVDYDAGKYPELKE